MLQDMIPLLPVDGRECKLLPLGTKSVGVTKTGLIIFRCTAITSFTLTSDWEVIGEQQSYVPFYQQ